jgi:hypothetical protein
LPPELFIVLIPGPLPLNDPPEDPLGGCPGVVEGEPGVEPPVIPGVDCPTDDPGMPPLGVCTPVEAPPPPPLDIVRDTPLDAGALVVAAVVVGGAVYTVLTSGGRVAPAAALPGIVVVPVTCVST